SPPRPGFDRLGVRGTDQRVRDDRGLHQPSVREPVDRDDARFRAGASLLLPARAARAAGASAQIRLATNVHSRTGFRHRRGLLCGLSGPGGRWVSTVWNVGHTGAEPRPGAYRLPALT